MSNKTELLIEANRRGLLKGEQKAMFDQAVSRGLINLPVSETPGEQLPTKMKSQQDMADFARRAQMTVDYGADDSMLGAIGSGFKRGLEKFGEGLYQRHLDIAEFFGADKEKERSDLEVSRRIQQQKYKPTQEEYPISSTVGEIGGSIAALPLPVGRIKSLEKSPNLALSLIGKFAPSAAAGGAYGATNYLESGEGVYDFAANIATDAGLGVVGELAAPFIQRGFNKGQALFSGLYKKATGADPRPEMFTETGLTELGKQTIKDLGITSEQFEDIYRSADKNLNVEQVVRQQRADELGIPLSKGQITRDFETAEAENVLKTGIGKQSEYARGLADIQQEKIRDAMEGFQGRFGEADRVATGESVQSALRGQQSEMKSNIRSLYDQASKTEGEMIPLNNDLIVDTAYQAINDLPVDDKVAKTLETVFAKFGLIGSEPTKKGRFSSVVDEQDKTITFLGEQTPLNLSNTEELRQALNQIRPSDNTGAVGKVINQLDEMVEEAIETGGVGAERQQAFEAARSAAREEKKIFNQKDIINNLVGYKKGTTTDAINPATVASKITQGKEGLVNLKKVKDTLMKNPNNRSLDAWKSIKAQSIGDLFSRSINPANGDISGQRLESAIKAFGGGNIGDGERKLRMLLGDEYKDFNNLRRAIGDATIPLKGTTNYSGTGARIINFLTRIGNVGNFGIGDLVLTMAEKTKGAAQARRTLRNMESSSPEKVKQAVKDNDEFIDSVIALGLSRQAQTE